MRNIDSQGSAKFQIRSPPILGCLNFHGYFYSGNMLCIFGFVEDSTKKINFHSFTLCNLYFVVSTPQNNPQSEPFYFLGVKSELIISFMHLLKVKINEL